MAEDHVRYLLVQEQDQNEYIRQLQSDFMQHEQRIRQVHRINCAEENKVLNTGLISRNSLNCEWMIKYKVRPFQPPVNINLGILNQ